MRILTYYTVCILIAVLGVIPAKYIAPYFGHYSLNLKLLALPLICIVLTLPIASLSSFKENKNLFWPLIVTTGSLITLIYLCYLGEWFGNLSELEDLTSVVWFIPLLLVFLVEAITMTIIKFSKK
jgi:hypothetical protein